MGGWLETKMMSFVKKIVGMKMTKGKGVFIGPETADPTVATSHDEWSRSCRH